MPKIDIHAEDRYRQYSRGYAHRLSAAARSRRAGPRAQAPRQCRRPRPVRRQSHHAEARRGVGAAALAREGRRVCLRAAKAKSCWSRTAARPCSSRAMPRASKPTARTAITSSTERSRDAIYLEIGTRSKHRNGALPGRRPRGDSRRQRHALHAQERRAVQMSFIAFQARRRWRRPCAGHLEFARRVQ